MNKILEVYLNQKKAAKSAAETRRKHNILIEEGLYTKVYAPENATDEELKEYPYYDTAYYKCVPIEVTDEEFEEVLKYRKISDNEEKNLKEIEQDDEPDNYNGVAVCFVVFAVLTFVGGFILGIVMGAEGASSYYGSDSDFNFGLAIAYWVASFVSGMTFIAIAEVLKLLTAIKNK